MASSNNVTAADILRKCADTLMSMVGELSQASQGSPLAPSRSISNDNVGEEFGRLFGHSHSSSSPCNNNNRSNNNYNRTIAPSTPSAALATPSRLNYSRFNRTASAGGKTKGKKYS